MENIEKAPNVPPFVRYCAMLVPTVFDDSLSYYEALCALSNWVQNNLVEVVNNNAEVTEEYIQLTNDLKAYVENYFANLDVQEEINNKLDAMVEDGTLGEIINQEIFGQINSDIADLESDVSLLSNDKVLLIGDSYLQGYNGETTVNGWGFFFKQASGLSSSNITTLAESGSGFLKTGNDGHTFKTLLEANASSISDKDKYTSIIIGFGLNDQGQGSSGQIATAIGEFVAYAKTLFTNAKFYLGLVGYSRKVNDGHPTIRQRLYERCMIASQLSNQYGVIYLNGVEQVAHNYALYGADDIHLTQDGYKALGWAIYQAWKHGNFNYKTIFTSSPITLGGDLADPSSEQLNASVAICGENRQVLINSFNVSFTPLTVASATIALTDANGMATNNLFRNVQANTPTLNLNVQFTLSDNTTVIYPCFLAMNNTTGGLNLNVPSVLNGSSIKNIRSFTANMFTMPTILS